MYLTVIGGAMGTLSFGQFRIINEHIVEFITDEGFDLDTSHAQECLAVYNQQPSPIGVLVNRSNDYSSTFEFNQMVSSEPKIAAMAILVTSERAAKIANIQKMYFAFPFDVFSQREKAIEWLNQHIDNAKNKN